MEAVMSYVDKCGLPGPLPRHTGPELFYWNNRVGLSFSEKVISGFVSWLYRLTKKFYREPESTP